MDLSRLILFPLNYPVTLGMRLFGCASEMGLGCLLAGAPADDDLHGQHTENCVVANYAPMINGDEDKAM
jgi:hypothetical protein